MTIEEREQRRNACELVKELMKIVKSQEFEVGYRGYWLNFLDKLEKNLRAPQNYIVPNPRDEMEAWMELQVFCYYMVSQIYYNKCEYSEDDSRCMFRIFDMIKEESEGFFNKKPSKKLKSRGKS